MPPRSHRQPLPTAADVWTLWERVAAKEAEVHLHDHEPLPQEAKAEARQREESEPLASLAIGAHRPDALDAGAMLHLQRSAGNSSVAAMLEEEAPPGARSPVLDVVGQGGGQPLDADTRSFMETSLGHDFSDVRVHTDGAATESARAVGAQAYTVGRDVVVQSDRWAPDTHDGRRMLAHELTHVVQQDAGPVDGTRVGGGIQVSDPSDRFEQEAERSADAVMSGVHSPAPLGTAPTPAVQRQEEDEPEELQGYFVQRMEAEEEPEEEPAVLS